MLDLIEHLVQWARAPGAADLPGQGRAARAPRGLGRRAARRDDRLSRAARRSETRELIASLLAIDETQRGRDRDGRRARRGQPAVRGGDGAPARRGGGRERRRAAATVQALLAARLDSLEPFQRRLLAHASVVGRTFWEGALAPVVEAEGGDLQRGAAGAAREGPRGRRRGERARRRARARVQARPDPRRGLRDAAQGGARAEALPGRQLHRDARRANASRRSSRCWPSTTGAPRSSRSS